MDPDLLGTLHLLLPSRSSCIRRDGVLVGVIQVYCRDCSISDRHVSITNELSPERF